MYLFISKYKTLHLKPVTCRNRFPIHSACQRHKILWQTVAFEIIFCRVIWTGGLVWWTTSWWLNGQHHLFMYHPSLFISNKTTLDHRDTNRFNCNWLFCWIGIEFCIPVFEDLWFSHQRKLQTAIKKSLTADVDIERGVDRPFKVVRLQKVDFHCFVEWFNRLFHNTMNTHLKRHHNQIKLLTYFTLSFRFCLGRRGWRCIM